eukprot:GHVN01067320.1.p1 GENE.GHVN01067320.1~~GHVN01067320.1.p1  ORF type:complete len:738 (+),score=72.70 GHVN01067320.1:147-2360(+)
MSCVTAEKSDLLQGASWTLNIVQSSIGHHIRDSVPSLVWWKDGNDEDVVGVIEVNPPSDVYTDLLRANVLRNGHPYHRLNEQSYRRWISEVDWLYVGKFDMQLKDWADMTHVLDFEGLDTVAEISLNGVALGMVANKFRKFSFDVTGMLGSSNVLMIQFTSMTKYGKEKKKESVFRPPFTQYRDQLLGRQYARKSQCDYGWDWGPAFAPVGIWDNILLRSFRQGAIDFVVPRVSVFPTDLSGPAQSPKGSAPEPQQWAAQIEVDVGLVSSPLMYPQENLVVRASLMDTPSDGSHITQVVLASSFTAVPHENRCSKQESSRESLPEISTTVTLRVENPGLWWPIGYSKNPGRRYPLLVELLHLPNGNEELADLEPQDTSDDLLLKMGPRSQAVVVDKWEKMIGLRKVTINQEPSKECYQDISDPDPSNKTHTDGDPPECGRHFRIEINNVPIFAKGANFIPITSFRGEYFDPAAAGNVDPRRSRWQDKKVNDRMDDPSYASRRGILNLEAALFANMNIVRVWGGGHYQDEYFYEFCDRNGLLVWQEMMFACSAYPTDPEFLENVRNEVKYQTRRLSVHPSVVIWSGNNEVEIGMTWDSNIVHPDPADNDGIISTKVSRDMLVSEYSKLFLDVVFQEFQNTYGAVINDGSQQWASTIAGLVDSSPTNGPMQPIQSPKEKKRDHRSLRDTKEIFVGNGKLRLQHDLISHMLRHGVTPTAHCSVTCTTLVIMMMILVLVSH